MSRRFVYIKARVTKLRINKLKLLGTNYLEGRSLLLIALEGIELHSPMSRLTTSGMHRRPFEGRHLVLIGIWRRPTAQEIGFARPVI